MRMLLLLWGCWREGERYYWGERERERRVGGQWKAEERIKQQIKREREK